MLIWKFGDVKKKKGLKSTLINTCEISVRKRYFKIIWFGYNVKWRKWDKIIYTLTVTT